MFFTVGLFFGIVLAVLAKLRKYPVWEIALWLVSYFVVGFLFGNFSMGILCAPAFIIRVITEKKGFGIGLASGALIVGGATALLFDFARVMITTSFFSTPELGAASVVGVLLIIAGLLIAFLSGRKERSLQERISEIDNLRSSGKISEEEYANLRKSILALAPQKA